MAKNRISESEWSVMEVLWQKHPLSSAEVIDGLKEENGWAANTVRTLLSRLAEKGFLKVSRSTGKFLYSPLTTREACVEQEGQSFLGRIFGGSSAPLLLHFAKSARLTPEEAKKLRDILDGKTRK